MTCTALPLPISEVARLTAFSFSQQQPTREKAEKVLLNTLSVLTVSYYLELMGISTVTNLSDSWNPVMRLCTDVADLQVPGIGKIECRPARTYQDFCYIPAETWSERAAYIIVVIEDSLLEAKIMGFVRNVETEELPLNQLQPLEDLPLYLAQQKLQNSSVVSLSRWFTGIIEYGWQTVDSTLDNLGLQPAYVFRSSEVATATRRAKLFDLGVQVDNQPIILIIEITPQSLYQTSVRIQLHPTDNIYLKPGVTLIVLDESGNLFLEAQSRHADNYIQLQFSGEVGERFSIRLGFDKSYITEHFII
ncbi:MAG: DUF1822 family protein [Calothrix sp. C42_A2020_038]|nr:DUF1822 family protein [Calothrix sp. C42_A2020_038]